MSQSVSEYEKAERIAKVFGGSVDEARDGTYSIREGWSGEALRVTLSRLLEVCVILECGTEELIFDLDRRDNGYCETCSDPFVALVFQVKRA